MSKSSNSLRSLTPDQLVNAIHADQLDAASLTPFDRRRCVDHLTHQTFTAPEIAALLKINPRTVTRDRAALRRAGAIAPSRTLGDEMLGEFERHTFNAIARFARLARDESNPPAVRLNADREITLAYRRLIETAHNLNYLEPGDRRLRDQRESDPKETQRAHQRMQRATQMLLGI